MMPLYLVEFLVRLGVAVIADGTIKPRWYGSDQAKVQEWVKRFWHGQAARVSHVTPDTYYKTRSRITGSNWQSKQYRKAASISIVKRLLA